MHLSIQLLLILSIGMSYSVSSASTTDYQEKDQWLDNVQGTVTTLDFAGFGDQVPFNDQYADLGVHFIGFDLTSGENFDLAPNDGWGLWGFDGETVIQFDFLVSAIGADMPGVEKVQLFREGVFIGESGWIGFGSPFGGIISEEPFDEVRWYDPPKGDTWFDDMYFVPIPAPGALGVFGFWAITTRRKRQCS